MWIPERGRPGWFRCAHCDKLFPLSESERQGRIFHPCDDPAARAAGPGTQLLQMLSLVHWLVGSGCGCEDRARKMDEWGPDECERRLDEIVGDLVGTADERILLAKFSPRGTKAAAARAAVKEAIRRARAVQAAPARLEFVSQRRLTLDLLELAGHLPPHVAGVVGIPRSGMIAAAHLACLLHVPLYTLGPKGPEALGHGYRLRDREAGDGPLAIVDDTVNSGTSLRQTRAAVAALQLSAPLLWVGVYVTPHQLGLVDYYARVLPAPHYLEWNLFNSVYAARLAYDFDGILCRDLPAGADVEDARYAAAIAEARPLYLTRRSEIDLIVTARPESMRRPTLDWLARWGVAVNRLVMWPHAKSERTAERVAAWKAEHYVASGHQLFVESNARLANAIQVAGRQPVLCPANETIYQ